MGKDNSLIDGGCAHGTYFDRLVSVQNNDLIEGPFALEIVMRFVLANLLLNMNWFGMMNLMVMEQ